MVVLAVTIFFSLFFGASTNLAVLTVVSVLVLLLNAVTLAIFTHGIIKASWHMMLQTLKLSPEV